jgi:hypothetical protein
MRLLIRQRQFHEMNRDADGPAREIATLGIKLHRLGKVERGGLAKNAARE